MSRGRPPGYPKSGGRKKGVTNKKTAEVKAILENAFNSIGGEEQFHKWAKDNLTEFYRLWGKMLPKDIVANVEMNTEGQIKIYLPDNGRDALEAHEPDTEAKT